MKIFQTWKYNTRRNKKFERETKQSVKQISKNKTKMNWNIYNWKTVGESFVGEGIIHGIFKYRFYVPLMLIGEKLLKKIKVKDKKDLSNEWYDEDLVMFDQLFDKSVHDWVYTYLACSRGYKNRKKVIFTQKQLDSYIAHKPSCKILRIMKTFVLTMVKYDTAYREFFTVLLHNIAIGFNKKYNGQVVRHLIYDTSSVYDVDYYYLGRVIKEQGIIENVQYTYELNGQIQVQPVAKEIKINNMLTEIQPKRLKVPKFDKKKYNKLVREGEKRRPIKKKQRK